MLEKIQKLVKHPITKQFKDIRFVGFCVFGVLVILVSWSGVGVIETNYKLQRQISELQQQNEVFALKNTNLDLGNQYYKTDQYLELQARQQFGKAAPGETIILVPKRVALARTTDMSPSPKAKSQQVVKKSYIQHNFEAWVDFLFRRNSTLGR